MLKNQLVGKYLLLLFFFVATGYNAFAYNFSAPAATSQILYYNILTDSTVSVTYPNHVGSSYYSGYAMPTGNLLIPSTVSHADVTYKVVSIDDYAFYACSGLTGIIVPNTVQSIGNNSCANCSGLVSIFLSNSVTSLGDNAFNGCSSLTSATIPNSVSLIGVGTFQGCSDLASVAFGSGLTAIGSLAFEGCSSLASVSIPSSVTMLGNWAFCNCAALDSLSIGESVSLIQQNTFSGCANVHYLKYNCRSATVAHISNMSCLPVSALTKVVVGDSVQAIPPFAFAGASHLSYLYLGLSLCTIASDAFASCDSIATIEVRRLVPPSIQSNTFANSLATLYIPCSSDSVYSVAPYWSDFNTISDSYPFVLSVVSNDTLRGNTTILQQPSCLNSMACFQAVANPGYHFLRWNDGSIENPRQIILSTDNHFVGIFVSDYSFINVLSNDTTFGTVEGAGRYYYQNNVTITAQPKVGYHFVEWHDGSTTNPRVVTVVQDSLFRAVFAPNEYRLTVEVSDTAMGSVLGNGVYAYASQIQLFAQPKYGYRFSQWSDGSTENPRWLTVISDSAISAIFIPNQYVATIVSSDTLWGNVLGMGRYNYLDTLDIEAVPALHCHFLQWNDGCTENPRQLILTSDTTFIAVFQPDYFQLISNVDSGMGQVQGAGAYLYGETVVLEATPFLHHHFVSWSDGVVANPRLVTMVADTTINAVFAEMPQYHIVAESNDPELGRVSGSGLYYYADTAQLVATPHGQHVVFYSWSDGCTDNPRIVQVIDDAQFTAVFGLERFSLDLSANDDDMGLIYGAGEYPYATEVTVIAVPYPGIEFNNWSDGERTNPRTVKMFSDVALQANFKYHFEDLGIDSPDSLGYVITVQSRMLTIVATQMKNISVFDIQGRLVSQSSNGQLVAALPTTGIYFVRVDGCQAQKVFVK